MAADPVTSTTVDDLLDYNFSDLDDPFSEKSTSKPRDDKRIPSTKATKQQIAEDKKQLGLGIDEEVKIVKKRQPIAKLDEARLLSEPGIPRIRRLARSGKIGKKLGFKGKGHEFSDVARLLNYYQVWLDGLYPRAKFADGLQLIEKVGHSKRMNIVRKTWIDEGKPGYHAFEEAGADRSPLALQPAHDINRNDAGDQGPHDAMFFQDPASSHAPVGETAPEDDELEAFLAENSKQTSEQLRPPLPTDRDEFDDLDVLMAEQDSEILPASGPKQGQSEDDDENDDLEALLTDQHSHNAEKNVSGKAPKRITMFEDDDEEDDLDALLAEQEALEKPSRESHEARDQVANNSPEPDDLDALLAEQDASL